MSGVSRRALIAALVGAVTAVPGPSALGSTVSEARAQEVIAGDQLAGMAMHPLWNGVSAWDWDTELRTARGAHADVVRIDVAWSSLELEGRGRWARGYASRLDAFLARARAMHIAVIATLLETPCWASSAPADMRQGCRGDWWNRGVTRYPPRTAHWYADAARYVVQRWGDSLVALEVWNEPNVPSFLHSDDPARDYARLVRATYRPVKRAAPRVAVLAGALALSDGDFLTSLLERGRIGGRYDAISYHPYTDGADPSAAPDERGAKWSVAAGTAWLRDILAAHGDDAPELWATEAGQSTCDPAYDARCVSEATQAAYIRDYLRVARRFPYLRAIVIYALRDSGRDRSDREQHFGLVRLDMTPKPALSAFRGAVDR